MRLLLLPVRRKSRIIPVNFAENVMQIWERDTWPNLTWQDAHVAACLAEVRHTQGRLIGRMEALGFKLREEAVLQTLTQQRQLTTTAREPLRRGHEAVGRTVNPLAGTFEMPVNLPT